MYKSGNSSSLNAPYFYNISNNSQPFVIEQSTSLDITLPIKKVSVHVQDPAGNPVANAKVVSNDIANGYLSLAGLQAYGRSYETNRYSDANGNVDIWLFPTYGSGAYSFTVYPPSGTPFAMFTIGNVTLIDNKSMVIVLQFIHAPPFTTANFTPEPNSSGNYPTDVTISLSGTATAGYTIAETFYSLDNGSEQIYSAPFRGFW